MKKILCIILLIIFSVKSYSQIKSGLLYDDSTKKVVWSYNENIILPIASLTKMMTVLLIVDDIHSGKLKWGDKVGNRTFYELVCLSMINSNNEASCDLAYTTDFIKRMNDRAKSLNMNNTFYQNPCGLPDIRDNSSTVLDLLILAKELIKNKDILTITKRYEGNHNKLVSHRDIDGLKTGFTKKAGFCIVATSNLNRRLICIVLGTKSQSWRNDYVFNKMNSYYKSLNLGEMK
jgi:D-alanyl-D-alanine carboxypeptidase (penicillin-binding protein 5/6)